MHAIENHCETALESPYSRDREEAIEALGDIFPDADTADQRRIGETLRDVASESSHREEREFALTTLLNCFREEPDQIEEIVVETLTDRAKKSKFSDERLDAMDALRDVYADLSEQYRDVAGQALAEIAGNGTYEDERKRARTRLSDVTRVERNETAGDTEDGSEESVAYLGQSLADHLTNAAHESREDCLQRAEELSEFLAEHPRDDGTYEDVREDVDNLVQALSVVSGETLAEDRIDRVERIASRVDRLYTRV